MSANIVQVVWRRRFVQVQAALAFVLLAVSAMLVRDGVRLREVDPGFDDADVATLRLALPMARYPEKHQVTLFYRELRERLQALPGMESVAFASDQPVTSSASRTGFFLESQSERPEGMSRELSYEPALYAIVTPGYFLALDVPLLGGRDFDDGDQWGAEAAVVVNRSWVRRWAGGAESEKVVGWPIEISMGGTEGRGTKGRIVGVVSDVRHAGLHRPAEPYVYLAETQFPRWDLCLIVEGKTAAAPNLEEIVRREVSTLDPAVPVYDVAALGRRLTDMLFLQRVALGLVPSLGLLVLALATLGLFGTTAVAVEQERPSIAVHLALGATPRQVRGRLVRQALTDVLVALGVGLVVTLVLLPSIGNLMSAGEPIVPGALIAAFGLLLASAVAAAWLASWRVTSIQPYAVLRLE